MAIRPIVRAGTESLVQPSQIVNEFGTQVLYDLLEDMKDTMKALNGVGIAAPQIGMNLRVVIFGFEQNSRYPNREPVPFTVLINPEMKVLSDELISEWEGCLSVPGLRGRVPRYKKIKYSGYDAEGNFFSRKVKDFHARVVQHELDHINGMLYLQRMQDMRDFGFEEELQRELARCRS